MTTETLALLAPRARGMNIRGPKHPRLALYPS
jgi:hypothetical protein